jgi:hypothetical protein
MGLRVGTDDRLLLLAIRTIAVSTRAAVRSNRQIGRPDLSIASARRGLVMLEELHARIPAGGPDVVRERYEHARDELMKAAGESGATDVTSGGGGSVERPSRGDVSRDPAKR